MSESTVTLWCGVCLERLQAHRAKPWRWYCARCKVVWRAEDIGTLQRAIVARDPELVTTAVKEMANG